MRNTSPIVLIAASIIALVGLGVTAIVAFFVLNAWFGVSVLAQAPDQPIDFPHTVHAGAVEDGGIGLDCTFCHRNVTEGAAATVPSVEQCMFCHSQVTGTTAQAQQEIAKLTSASEAAAPINWKRGPQAA